MSMMLNVYEDVTGVSTEIFSIGATSDQPSDTKVHLWVISQTQKTERDCIRSCVGYLVLNVNVNVNNIENNFMFSDLTINI